MFSLLLASFQLSHISLFLALPPPFSYRLQTDEEKTLSESAQAASAPVLRVVAVDSSSTPTPTPANEQTNTRSSESSEPATATAAGALVADVTAPSSKMSLGDGGNGDGEDDVVVVRVPLESLNPEAFCLTPVSDRWLRIRELLISTWERVTMGLMLLLCRVYGLGYQVWNEDTITR